MLGVASSIPIMLLPGVHGNALWIGMIVAFCITFLLESIDTPKKSGAAVVLASLSSGYFSSSISNFLVITFPTWIDSSSRDGLLMISAILIAAAVPTMIAAVPYIWPIVLRILNRKGDSI